MAVLSVKLTEQGWRQSWANFCHFQLFRSKMTGHHQLLQTSMRKLRLPAKYIEPYTVKSGIFICTARYILQRSRNISKSRRKNITPTLPVQ
jgi:hypothetical protein